MIDGEIVLLTVIKEIKADQVDFLEESLDALRHLNIPQIIKYVENEIDTTNLEIFEYIDTATKGYLIRTRTKYYEHGEKSSKYFLSLEYKQGDSKCIKRLLNDRGEHIEDPKDILSEEIHFYKKLYTSGIKEVN